MSTDRLKRIIGYHYFRTADAVERLSGKGRRFLREKEARKLLSEFSERVKGDKQHVSLDSPVEVAGTEEEGIFFVNGEPVFARSRGVLFPTLSSCEFLSSLPRAVVNMGAIPYVCNGADIMAPGIVSFEGDFDKDDFVVVSDERHNKAIAIAVALWGSEEAKKLDHGKVLKNMHYVGDSIWNMIKTMGESK